MHDKALISVIIPVYRVENFIKRCVDSVIVQTYQNIEIILVDDGSDDECPTICDGYKKIDPRVKVIHKANGGLSDARNAGIEHAKGEYLLFIDSDDFIANTMIEKLYMSILDNKSDVAICEFRRVNDHGIGSPCDIDYSADKRVFSREEIFSLFDNKKYSWLLGVAWNKLYKRKIFKELRYPVGKVHEDDFISHEIYSRVESVSFVYDELYYYVQRESSIMGESYSFKRIDEAEAQLNRIDFAIKTGRTCLIRKSEKIVLRVLWNATRNASSTNIVEKRRLAALLERYKITYKIIARYCSFSWLELIRRSVLFLYLNRLNKKSVW